MGGFGLVITFVVFVCGLGLHMGYTTIANTKRHQVIQRILRIEELEKKEFPHWFREPEYQYHKYREIRSLTDDGSFVTRYEKIRDSWAYGD